MKIKMKLSELKKSEDFQLRKTSLHVVSGYKEAYKSGAQFPLITVDQNNVVIAGYHRLTAMIGAYGEDSKVYVNLKEFDSDKERMIYAVGENSKHGLPLSSFDRKNCYHALNKYSVAIKEICDLLSVKEDRLKDWDETSCIVINPKTQEQERKPLKNGTKMLAQKVVEKPLYDKMMKKYSGQRLDYHMSQIINHITDKTWEQTPREIEKMKELKRLLNKLKVLK